MSEMNNDVTPESLMDNFRGPGFIKMVVVTVVVHIVVLIGASLPYLKRTIFGADSSKMTKEQKMENAMDDATSALRKIAAQHGLNPQDISDQFAATGSRTVKPDAAVSGDSKDAAAVTVKSAEPEKPKSAIERELEKSVKGPEIPAVGNDDIF